MVTTVISAPPTIPQPSASSVHSQQPDAQVPARPSRVVGRVPTTEEEEEDNVNANLNALRLVMQPQKVERHGKRLKR